MKTLITIILMTLLVTACSSKPDYRPANKGSVGYSEQKITNDRFRVQFKSVSTSVADAADYALLRSAELTQAQGFDWFVVTSKETFVESEKVEPASAIGLSRQQRIERRCGLLTCETYSRPANEIGVSFSSANSRKEVHSILEIRMGKGVMTNESGYNAADVVENLSNKLETNDK
ncbi:MAG: hypothetical protein ACJAWS_000093 [Oleiphilaceae bacterium]|jgi:hypothetical protein|uniref:CC0125/CC1285 family lipoprotein n=1 Tax=Colwellia sp. 6M3 TaxID=2759849 RepID=UPI0015F460D3|nr:hypothetical protein [Colwellia sp. 6M3]MBA6416568.1 hypothetical protein [Colwellia sp. 6M3]|tara:strand:- start:20804 stop:21328 length:525 start_codon:yes stop_codon:yes gene_type:complete